MSVDPTQITIQPTLSDMLLPMVTPVVQEAVSAAQADVQSRLTALEAAAAAQVAVAAPAVIAGVASVGAAVIHTVETDPLTQRVIVWSIVGAVLVAALAVIGFALLGNSTAMRWIGAAPAAIVAVVLWVSSAGALLPNVPAKK